MSSIYLDAWGTGAYPSDIRVKCKSADCFACREVAVFDSKFMALGTVHSTLGDLSFSKVSLLKGLDHGLAACSDQLFRQSFDCSE